MGLYTYDSTPIPKSDRIPKLVENLYAKMPEIESARAVLITESYKQTENEPMIIRRAKAFQHILENIPITARSGCKPPSPVLNSVPIFLAAMARDFWAFRLMEPKLMAENIIGVSNITCGGILVTDLPLRSTCSRSGLRPKMVRISIGSRKGSIEGLVTWEALSKILSQ